MFTLPSFLTTFPFSLPSLPSISLPANIQRRFLSYVLKRALGRFVKDEALDADRIQAQISEGWLEIEGLELDTDEINAIIPAGIPLRLVSGGLSKITAQVPISNLWSDPLCLNLDELSLCFALSPSSVPPKGKSRDGSELHTDQRDLAESVTSAAGDFLHQELDAHEEAELDRSIRQSLILTQNDPFSGDGVPGSFPFERTASPNAGSPLPANVESTTVLAGLVERILARLEFRIRTIRVQIRVEDDEHGGIFELRVGEVFYADETAQAHNTDGDNGKKTTQRAVRISRVSVYMLPLDRINDQSHNRPHLPSSFSTSSISSSNTSSSSNEDYPNMVMSQAVADLRDSTMSATNSEASMFFSAISEAPMTSVRGLNTYVDSESSSSTRSATPTPPDQPTSLKESLILTFGSEDIVFRMKTTRLVLSPDAIQTTDPSGSRASYDQSTTLQSPSVKFELNMGSVALAILPKHLPVLLAATRCATRADQENTNPSTALQQTESRAVAKEPPPIVGQFCLKGLHAIIVYDLSAENSADFATALQQYWIKPGTASVPVGHLRFRTEQLDIEYASIGCDLQPHARGTANRNNASMALRLPRRQTNPAGFRTPVFSLTLKDASIFEHLPSTATSMGDPLDPPLGGIFPVLLFDNNLPKQYDLVSGLVCHGPGSLGGTSTSNEAVFPHFDTADWRNPSSQRKTAGEKQWKVRQKGRGILKGAAPVVPSDEKEIPALELQKDMTADTTATVSLQPIHVFLDLSLVERLLPMLRQIAPAVHAVPPRRNSDPPLNVRPSSRPALPPRHSAVQSVIDDLDAQVSVTAVRPRSRAVATIRCAMVRLDIRCPAPINHRETWGDGGHLRSGIVTLDIHQIAAEISAASSNGQLPLQQTSGQHSGSSLEWERMLLFFCRAREKRSSAFLVVGPLAPDPDDQNGTSLLPLVNISTNTPAIESEKTTSITCRIPCVQAIIRQHTVEGLQFFADDITHWLDGAFGDGSAPKPRDDLKMIGSRFFGAPGSTRGSSSASSSAIVDDDEQLSATTLHVYLNEADVTLFVPRADRTNRTLSLRAIDIDTKVESNVGGRRETAVSLSVMDATFSDRSDAARPLSILGRTTSFTLASHQVPSIQLRFSSATNVSAGTKETGISVICNHLTLYLQSIEWVDDLQRFAKTPEGVFEDVVPSEMTRISVQLNDVSLHAATPTLPGAVVLVLGTLEAKTEIRSEADDSIFILSASRLAVLAIDNLDAVVELASGVQGAAEVWKRAGYARLLEIVAVEADCMRDLSATRIELQVNIRQLQVTMTACADSLATFGQLSSDLGNLVPRTVDPASSARSSVSLEESINVFDSIDEDAFNLVPDIVSGADMIDDDLPTNLDYIDRASRIPGSTPSTDQATGESLRVWQTEGDDAEEGGETIKLLYHEPFDMDEEYWDALPILNKANQEDSPLGKLHVKLHECNVSVLLYEGYDWVRTRKAIKDEMRAVRRRLERIRQLLASGQKADDGGSFDIGRETKSVLFNSIHIGLNKGDTSDAAALIAAIDEELDQLGDTDAATESSWQTLPPAGPGHPIHAQDHRRTQLRGKKLTRSKKPQIEIALTNLRASYDTFPPAEQVSSKVEVQIKEMDILDHIKTSTWKKFLMGMKADSRGNVRETDADLVRLELQGVRLQEGGEEEMRLRAKILPLRLHVDQDALDFLKRFFSFKPSIPAPSQGAPLGSTRHQEPFFQHVEIFPIELKLDYKPKRVDFSALREGKTIELMNFFHFDGAEMTLRHITLSGVTGWDRLGTTLQDLWTPDVKANQLADVISGVSPIRSIVNVGSGVADLILLPIEQYRKDGRLAKGVQRGTNSFVKSTAVEMMKLGARLATGTQVVLEKAEGVLGGKFDQHVVGQVERSIPATSPSMPDWDAGDALVDHLTGNGSSSEDEGEVVSRYANQPESMKEGVQAAYKSLSKNVNAAAQTILAVPMEVYERSGDDGPLKAVVRAVPIAVLKPMIGTTEAVSKTLLGMRNSLDPTARRELGDKYK
ncbi:hypothetical protein IAU60_001999 [Kwoniella sp. DSM 27419]